MKRILALALGLLCLLGAVSAPAEGAYANRLEKILGEGQLILGTSPDYAPHEFIDPTQTGQASYVGADISMAYYIAEQLGVELVIEAMDYETMQTEVGNGTIDLALAGMAYQKGIHTGFTFTDIYFDEGDQVILVKADELDTYSKLSAFAGKNVAAQNGTVQMGMIVHNLKDATPIPADTISVAVMMLKTGKAVGAVLPSAVADQYVANHPDLAVCPQKFTYKASSMAGGVPGDEAEYLARINEIIQTVVDERLYFVWMDEACEQALRLAQ